MGRGGLHRAMRCALERIAESFPLEILEHHLVVGDFLDVFRVDRHLSAAAGGVDDVLGHRIAGSVPAKGADDLDALAVEDQSPATQSCACTDR